MKYNGWSNYETWNVVLWMDNDPITYDLRRQWVWYAIASYYDDTKESQALLVAQDLQEWVEENNPLADKASMYADILSANLHEVNWLEIAKHWVEEAGCYSETI